MPIPYRSGLVALIGRPNVGKSTLLNCLVGQKVSITSSHAQTTRQRMLAIKTADEYQIIYVDTPGLHEPKRKIMSRYMNRSATGSLLGVDSIVLMITTRGWQKGDKRIVDLLKDQKLPIILVINKIDMLKSREQLLPLIENSNKEMSIQFEHVIPVSAKDGTNVSELEKTLVSYLPIQDKLFPEDQLTDRSERFMAAELIREQILRTTKQEVPHAVAVGIESFKRQKKIVRIEAIIWVEKKGQKGIIIGSKGELLKLIGTRARLEIEKLLNSKVYLNLWVKVRENWQDNETVLRSLGICED